MLPRAPNQVHQKMNGQKHPVIRNRQKMCGHGVPDAVMSPPSLFTTLIPLAQALFKCNLLILLGYVCQRCNILQTSDAHAIDSERR